MISEQTKKKFAIIFRNMTPDQRATLQAHLLTATEDQKWEIIEKIVATYESKANNPFVQSELNPTNEIEYTDEEEIPYEPEITEFEETYEEDEEDDEKPARTPKRRLKKSVKNTLTGFIVVILLLSIALLVLKFKETIFAKISEETEPTQQTEIIETTVETTPSPTPTVTPTPAPTIVPVAANHPDLTGLTVVIDPGHQETTDYEQELYASWLSATKPRCTCGTTGVVTETPEYDLTLQYSLIIRDYLEQCGANVILTRDANDVNISNQERAQIANVNGADVFIRIHADAAGDSAASGVRVYTPDSGSFTDTSPEYAEQLAELVAEAEGLEVNAVRATSLYTGLNYANTLRSFQISLGFLSNSDDEAVLVTEENRAAVAEAISVFCEEFV
ncbi:MAG: N-acetylmuramoyl-L-alanine amidase [Clostridiales bacterium]|nr:N-acetylmuramoyl-L-alanine amidase [Clostridiales bacterium]